MARYDWPAPARGDDDPAGRAAHLRQFRPGVDPLTIGPAIARQPAGPGARAAPRAAPAGNQNLWFPIGPSVMTNGQAGGRPNMAGRIRDLQVEPAHGLRIYAASAGGGVWFSADRGETWRPLDDWQVSDLSGMGTIASALSCGAVHVIWGGNADGADDIVWVGTGEAALTSLGEQALPGAAPGGLQIGGSVAGIGLLNRDPAVSGGSWTVVKGDEPGTDPDTLRGESFYRIAGDPANSGQLLAATTKGLYLKPPGGAWTRITTFATSVSVQPMDVLMTRLTGPDRVRIWVAAASTVMVAEFAGVPATAITPGSLAFRTVSLFPAPPPARFGTCLQLATDGTTVYVLGRSPIPPGSKRATPPAALWRIDASADLAHPTAAMLTGTPPDLFLSAGDQSSYDMCLAAHPDVAGRLYLGGAAIGTATGLNAAVYRCETAASAVTPTMIGEGVHFDSHVIRVGAASPSDATKRTVWIGCDGGLFRSDADGDPGTFAPRNNGLAVLQPGFVASHPTNPGIVVAGFQDNGTAVRTGDGVWEQTFQGDGGGVTYEPRSPHRYFRQYTLATWHSSDGGSVQPVMRRGARAVAKQKTSETLEAESSLFYSGADSVLHGGDTHLALGTDRVWYSRDWGRSWVTLPTATDPRGGDNPDLRQDVLTTIGGSVNFTDRVGSADCCSTLHAGTGTKGSAIITVRLSAAPSDRSGNLVLRALVLQAGGLVWLTGTRPAASTGPFTWTPITSVPRQLIKYPVAGSADETAFGNGQPLSFLPAPGVVSDVGVHDPARGTLGSCYVTTTGVPYPRAGLAPVPLDTLWFFDGTSTWLPTGLRNTHPNGSWTVPGDRVTAPALGVIADPDDRAIVYVATSVGVVKGVLTIGGTSAAPTYAWAWEQLMNGLPEAVVQDLAIFQGSGLKLLRAATQSRGVWEVDLASAVAAPLTYLRLFRTDTRRVLPTPTGGDLLNDDPANPAHWDDSPDLVIDATGVTPATPPSEAELLAIPAAGPATAAARVSVAARHIQVHVLAHHRVGDLSVPADQVRIALVRHAFPGNGVVPLGGLWTALVAAAASATQPASLPDGWASAAAALWQNPAGPVDPRLPRAVSFSVDLSADPAGTAIVLLAVVMSTSDQISDADLALGGAVQAQTADQLVVASPHAAAKSLFVS